MCWFSEWELKHNVNDFYRMIDNMVKMNSYREWKSV